MSVAVTDPNANVPASAPQRASMFDMLTRRKVFRQPTYTRPVGGGTTLIPFARTGYLAGIALAIRGTVAGTLTAPNVAGMASIIRRVRLQLNSGLDIVNISGVGYHYGLRQMLDFGYDPVPASNARSAVTATAFNLDMYIPLMLNLRDPIGLVLLQSEATTVTLVVEWEADATVATGATVSATVQAYPIIFTAPSDPIDQPNQNIVHQILEDPAQVYTAAQPIVYNWPRGGNYLQLFHLYGIAAGGGTDKFNQVQIRAAQSDYIQDTDVPYLDIIKTVTSPQARIAGTIPLDFYATNGMGMYGSMRDTIDTSVLTDMATIINATAADTLYSVRRQLLYVPG